MFGSGNIRPVGENGCTFDSSPLFDQAGLLYGSLLKISIDFRLIKQTDNSIDELIEDIEAFYRGSQNIFALLYDDHTMTAHAYGDGTPIPTFGNIRVTKPPSYMRYQNGEHVSYRTGTVELEAVLRLIPDDPFHVLEFSESIDLEGGGPVFGHLQPNEGLAVKQRLRTNELWRGTQSGRIVHLRDYGSIPRPIWPGALVGRPKLRAETPRRVGTEYIGFPTSYTYTYESATPLNGEPTR
jgi:hypothetical protein